MIAEVPREVLERNALGPGECSCGVPDCPELGWPHEWNPSMDNCALGCSRPLDVMTAIRWGSGYAHPECAVFITDPVNEPLTWEGDQA